jgi:hypothetical protein
MHTTLATPPSLDDLQAAVLSTRATRDRLESQRAELDRGAPADPLQREAWYDARADIALLDRDLNRSKAAAVKAENEWRAAKSAHYTDVFSQARPERQLLLRSLMKALDAAAVISAELVTYDAEVGAECDGRTFPPDHLWADLLVGVDCRLENWKRILRAEKWL